MGRRAYFAAIFLDAAVIAQREMELQSGVDGDHLRLSGSGVKWS
jgi:hypothetical protein